MGLVCPRSLCQLSRLSVIDSCGDFGQFRPFLYINFVNKFGIGNDDSSCENQLIPINGYNAKTLYDTSNVSSSVI